MSFFRVPMAEFRADSALNVLDVTRTDFNDKIHVCTLKPTGALQLYEALRVNHQGFVHSVSIPRVRRIITQFTCTKKMILYNLKLPKKGAFVHLVSIPSVRNPERLPPRALYTLTTSFVLDKTLYSVRSLGRSSPELFALSQ